MTATIERAASALPVTLSPAWRLCPGCRALLYGEKVMRNAGVCPECGHHFMLTAAERAGQLFDEGSVALLDVSAPSRDALNFVDTMPYRDRLARARRSTGLTEAVLCVEAAIDGKPVVSAIMDFRFLGGSLGAGVGELITQTAEHSLRTATPLLLVCASGGARMQEGMHSLMQMAKTAGVLADLDEAGILTIALITDPTYGGVAASFASLCDITIAEPRARLGFAGPRVIAQTTGGKLPPGFQTAEFLLERGLIDVVAPRPELRPALSGLLTLTCPGQPGPQPAPQPEPPAAADVPAPLPAEPCADPWLAVGLARDLGRPRSADFLGSLLSSYLPLRGDRAGADCPAILGGIGMLGRQPVAVIAQQKGRTPKELMAHNFGMASPAGYRKAGRIMRLAAKLGIPLITLIDTPGAAPGVDAEETGQAMAVAESIRRMLSLRTATLAVVIGEGGSGGALALGVADRVLALQNAVYSVISPEGCAAILWRDAAAAPQAARALQVDAGSLLQHGMIDGIIAEPPGGAHADHQLASALLNTALREAVADLVSQPVEDLVRRRRKRFREFGDA
jgi:acetyl-CoA carboxylase carboxyl transferase beta subunit/acetyl-CoA carboxylase carboxyl transferase alpha subunit